MIFKLIFKSYVRIILISLNATFLLCMRLNLWSMYVEWKWNMTKYIFATNSYVQHHTSTETLTNASWLRYKREREHGTSYSFVSVSCVNATIEVCFRLTYMSYASAYYCVADGENKASPNFWTSTDVRLSLYHLPSISLKGCLHNSYEFKYSFTSL